MLKKLTLLDKVYILKKKKDKLCVILIQSQWFKIEIVCCFLRSPSQKGKRRRLKSPRSLGFTAPSVNWVEVQEY